MLPCWIVEGLASPSWAMPLNAVLGDAGFEEREGRPPRHGDREEDRIDAHLELVIRRLRASKACTQRSQLLEVLDEYRRGGVFPHNDCIAGRSPVFIDNRGTHCAVGQLIRESGHPDLAEALDRHFHTGYVAEMIAAAAAAPTRGEDDAAGVAARGLLLWAGQQGFSAEELAMIQPGYTPAARCAFPLVVIGCPIMLCVLGVAWWALFFWSLLSPEAKEHLPDAAAKVAWGAPCHTAAGLGLFVVTWIRRHEMLAMVFALILVLTSLSWSGIASWIWAVAQPPVWLQVFLALGFSMPLILLVWLVFACCCAHLCFSSDEMHRFPEDVLESAESSVASTKVGSPLPENDSPSVDTSCAHSPPDHPQAAEE